MINDFKNPQHERCRSRRLLMLGIVAVLALITAACSGPESADGDVVVATDSMSTEELTDFAAQSLRTAFADKATINMNIEMNMAAMFGAMNIGDVDIQAELEAEGLTEADLIMNTRIVAHIDGQNFEMSTFMDGGLFGTEGFDTTDIEPLRILSVDGVIYQEFPSEEISGSASGTQWFAMDDGLGDYVNFDITAFQQQTFEKLEDVVDHGAVDHNGEQLQRITATLRGNELLRKQLEQQQGLAEDFNISLGALGEQMTAVQTYIAEHSVTSFDVLLDVNGDVQVVSTEVRVDAEAQFEGCAMFTSAEAVKITMAFEQFPDDLVLAAPPADSVTSMSEMMQETGAPGIFDQDGLLNAELFGDEEMDAMDAWLEEFYGPMLANCPTA